MAQSPSAQWNTALHVLVLMKNLPQEQPKEPQWILQEVQESSQGQGTIFTEKLIPISYFQW